MCLREASCPPLPTQEVRSPRSTAPCRVHSARATKINALAKSHLSPPANIRSAMTYIELPLSPSAFIRANVQHSAPRKKVLAGTHAEEQHEKIRWAEELKKKKKITGCLMPKKKKNPKSTYCMETNHMLQNVSTAHRRWHFSSDN